MTRTRWGALVPDEAKAPGLKMSSAVVVDVMAYGALMEQVGRYMAMALAATKRKDAEAKRVNFTFMFSAKKRAEVLLHKISAEWGNCPCDAKLLGFPQDDESEQDHD